MGRRCRHDSKGSGQEAETKPVVGVVQAKITTLGLPGDLDVRALLRRALRDSEPAAQRFGWHLSSLHELPANDDDVGYTEKDGTIFIKVRDPTSAGPKATALYSYSFILATLLHELVHLTHLGHGKAFYRCLTGALAACGAEAYVRREARGHVCAELLNAVCDNDARRARALLAVLPEAAMCRRSSKESSQLPLEYAAHHGRVAMTKLLLEARADPAICSSSSVGSRSIAPLARAAANGNTKTAALLLAARADVVEVSDKQKQTVLDKAIAAAEAGGIVGKGGEWWNISKVLSNSHADRDLPKPSADALRPRRSRAARSNSRRRKRHTGEESTVPTGPMPRRVLSMPALPSVPSLPSLSGSSGSEGRRPMAFSCLAGSLAL